MIPKSNLVRLLFFFVPMLLASEAIVIKTLGAEFWWAGVLAAQCFYLYFRDGVLRGFDAISYFGLDRIKLNLSASGIKTPALFPFQRRGIVLFAVFISIFLIATQAEVESGFNKISNILLPEGIVLRIESASWSERMPIEKVFSATKIEARIDTASYIEIKAQNSKISSWDLYIDVLSDENSSKDSSSSQLFERLGINNKKNYGVSVARLYELFNIDKKKRAKINIQVKNSYGEIFSAFLAAAPLPVPMVTLDINNAFGSQGQNDINSLLKFKSSVTSEIPLLQLELAVRTESGYKFTKTVAEYAGSTINKVKELPIELNTIGIPFTEGDSLYVKAIAKTIVPSIEGVSNEIKIEIKTPQEIRAKLIEKLNETLKNLTENSELWKPKSVASLADAFELSDSLGKRSVVKRRISEAYEHLKQTESKKDGNFSQTQKKIKAALESLQRAQKLAEAPNLLSRLQAFYSMLKRADANNSELKPMARNLITLTSQVKEKLKELLNSGTFGLTSEEKKHGLDLLSGDKTENKLAESHAYLEKSNGKLAAQFAGEAVEEAKNNIGAVLQSLLAARERSFKIAKDSLLNADKKLQSARSKTARESTTESKGASEHLSAIPNLGQPFDEFTSDAKQETKNSIEHGEANNSQKLKESLDKAQDSIARAVSALQEQEEQDRSEERERDGYESRRALELISAQGELDATWRKRILDEIATLKEKGEKSDSATVKFLESRLR